MESNTMLSIYFILLLISQFFSENKNIPPKTKSSGDIELQIASIKKNPMNESCLDAKVLIINNTDTVASFFEDWNSWGWFNISLKLKTSDTTYTINKIDRDWPKNFPSFKTLFPVDTLELKYLLSFGDCNSSQFNKIFLRNLKDPVSLQAIYQLPKGALEDADLKGEIKYKEKWIVNHWVILDSLKTPVEINRTFVTSQLQSKEYILTN